MNKIEDIFQFVKEWRSTKGIPDDTILTEDQIEIFVGELQKEICKMDFSLPEGTTIIGYSGSSNGTPAWKIIGQISSDLGDDVKYISDLPAGQLLDVDYRDDFEALITECITNNKNSTSMIISGMSSGTRVSAECGYGDYLSLDDFVSSKLIGESTRV